MSAGEKDLLRETRLLSLDTLRGFAMFWIIGGGEFFKALAASTGWRPLTWLAGQLTPLAWHGGNLESLVFPLFLFLAGVSFPISLARYSAETSRLMIHMNIIRRGVILVLLGIIYNNAINSGDAPGLRYCSVLGRIGCAWAFAAFIYLNCDVKRRIRWFWGILIGYWMLLVLYPAHDLPGGQGPFSPAGNLAGYIDRIFMPGRLDQKIFDSEGVLSTFPAIATALLGMEAGQFVMSPAMKKEPLRILGGMGAAGLALTILGWLWSYAIPLNKVLWSSSFVCFTGGISLLLLALFYLLIEVLELNQWGAFFAVIGINSITIYMATRFLDFSKAATFLFGDLIAMFPPPVASVCQAFTGLNITWLFLYVLYKGKIFLKV